MNRETGTKNSVQAVDRALTIVELLKNNPSGIGVTELSHHMDLSKSTVHRLLTSLLTKGYVIKDNMTEQYKLGLKFVEMSAVVLEGIDLRQAAADMLRALADEFNETVHLAIPDQGEVVYIDKIDSNETIRMISRIGKRAPLHCTGIGKILLAHMDTEEVEAIIRVRGLRRFTEYTITSESNLMNALAEIKEKGYSLDEQEHELGIRCAAVPIFDNSTAIAAGISISGPVDRMTDAKIQQIIPVLQQNAQEISRRLGYLK
ncbi:IclR family transcriptional regulator [Terribacillus saccharophilus]|uniref:IclR family transcriptional regulator n=1 Tax=Terribacillus saccharophilus TaxID=361277 RepID=UPI003981E89B